MNIPQHSLAAVTIQRAIRKQKAVKEFQTLKRAATKIQARVRGHQLLEAAESGDISEVENLLARGADVNATDKYGITALHWAAKAGKTEVVEALVIAGADVNATDNDGETVLQFAKKGGHYVKLKKAIEEGKQKLISLYEHSLHPEVTQERLNDLLGKIIKKNTDSKICSNQIFEYANSKRLSKKQIDQVNKYIEEREAVTIQKERASVTIQTAYRGYLERKK